MAESVDLEPEFATSPLSPPVAIEPLPGFVSFCQTMGLKSPAAAALSTWMKLHGHDPFGHYPLAVWKTYWTQTLAHT